MSLGTLARGLLGRKGLGLKPGAADPNDWDYQKLGLASSALPAACSLRHLVPEVYNQLGTNSCVAQSTVMAIRIALAAADLDIISTDFSTLFVYFNARAESGDERYDLGAFLRNGPKAVQKCGLASSKAWPFLPARVNRRPSWLADRGAALWWDYQGYYRIWDTGDERLRAIKAAIAAGKPVIGGWAVSEAFLQDLGPHRVGPPGVIAGNHAMVITGYDENGDSEVLSSWGEQWRDHGFIHMTPEYVLQAQDLFVLGVGGLR